MKHTTISVWGALGAMAGLLGGTWAGSAAGLSLGFSSSAGGGGSCSGGMFNLNCAVGQADAGVCTGSAYVQQGGFVPGLVKTVGPPLSMARAGNQFNFTWPNICAGFVLDGGRAGLEGAGQRHGGRREPKASGLRVRLARVLPAAEGLSGELWEQLSEVMAENEHIDEAFSPQSNL